MLLNRCMRMMLTVGCLMLGWQAGQARADVLIKAEKHPAGRFLSTNFTVYTDTQLLWQINKSEGSLYFNAGTQLALPWNSSYRFAQAAIISYDQRKLYEVEAGTQLTTPDYVPEVVPSEPPREPADQAVCLRYQDSRKGVQCVVVTDKEHENDDVWGTGAYTSVNTSVSGSGSASGTARVEGCNAFASGSASVVGSGSASVEVIAQVWGCSGL